MAAENSVDLGTAEFFALLAGSTITTTGTTIINGDVGLHPGTVFSGQDTAVVNGEVHLANAVALQAKNDMLAAYDEAVLRTITDPVGAELANNTMTAGVYGADSELQITGTLTLDGQNNPDAVFIFKAGSTLTTASDSKIVLINGADYNNIFWLVGTSATLGTNSEFAGNILAKESITVTTGAEIQGKLMAYIGAITLDSNEITNVTTSALTVIKVVEGDTTGITLPTFEITVTGPEGFVATRNFVHNESYTWNNLVPGVYNIVENRTRLNSRWAVAGEGDVEVLESKRKSVTITNTYTPRVDSTPVDSAPIDITPVDSSPVVSAYGTLTVGKIVGGDPAGMSLQTFEIMVTGPGNFSETKSFVHNEVFTWSNLVPGDYTVTENRNSLGDGWIVSGEGVVTVNANQAHSATITNVYSTPVITIPVDTTPIDVPAVEVTNGTLTVRKIVTGDTSGMTLPEFEITVTGPEGFTTTKTFVHNESFTWVNLVPGEYTITENKTGLNSRWAVSGEGAAQVVANQTTMTTITNNYRNVVGIPQTSQNTDYGTAMALGMIALMLAGAGVLSAKTRKKYRA